MYLRTALAPLIILVSCILSVTSCTFQELELVGVEDVRITKFSQDAVEMEVQVKVKNPNNYSVSLVGSDLLVYINDESMGTAKIKNNVRFPSNSNDSHVLKLINKPENMLKAGLTTLFSFLGKSSIRLRVKGEIKGRAFLVNKKITVDIKETVRF